MRRDEPLANHTTMRIGGPADLFITVNETEQLVRLCGWPTNMPRPSWFWAVAATHFSATPAYVVS